MTHLLQAIVRETLDRFLGLLKPGAKGGLLGQIARGPGVGMLSRIAAQMAPLRKAATRFASGSVEAMMGPVVKLLSSPEMQARLGRMRAEGVKAALGLETAEVISFLETLPLHDLIDLVPEVIAHNLARPEVRQTILDEVEAALDLEADHPIRDLIGQEAAEVFREEASRLGASLLVDLARSERLAVVLAGWA